MPRSDFYVLPSPDPDARQRFLLKLAEKVYGLGRRVYIRVDSELAAQQLDNQLWDYREEAFLPHSLIGEAMDSPIEIGAGDALPKHRDVYINLALQIPDLALEFDRAIEIVVQEEAVLAATRDNYRRYKERGFDIHMNDMRRKG